MPQVVTANRLRDGTVVFLGPDREWSEVLQGALLLDGKESVAAALEGARLDEAENRVVEPYAIDVLNSTGIVAATKLREAIRAQGPTVHPEFGKPQPALPVAPEDDHVSV